MILNDTNLFARNSVVSKKLGLLFNSFEITESNCTARLRNVISVWLLSSSCKDAKSRRRANFYLLKKSGCTVFCWHTVLSVIGLRRHGNFTVISQYIPVQYSEILKGLNKGIGLSAWIQNGWSNSGLFVLGFVTLFLYPLKTSENQRFLTRNGLSGPNIQKGIFASKLS